LEQIRQCSVKSEEGVIILLHQIIASFGKAQNVQHEDGKLNSKTSVRPWEANFVKSYIQPALADLPNSVKRQRAAMQKDKLESVNVIQAILYEKSQTTNDRSKILSLPQFWCPRENIAIDGIEAKIGSKKFKDHCPFLLHFLKEDVVFHELLHLPTLLELATFLIKNFSRRLEVRETDSMKIDKFISKMEQTEREYVTPLVNVFLSVLKNLQVHLFSYNQ